VAPAAFRGHSSGSRSSTRAFVRDRPDRASPRSRRRPAIAPAHPNTLLDDDGQPSGHVDFGSLGLADQWADLAVATWSTEWNYGPGWTDILLDAYGVGRDEYRINYYRLLWDLGP
jgi:hypothetical protein